MKTRLSQFSHSSKPSAKKSTLISIAILFSHTSTFAFSSVSVSVNANSNANSNVNSNTHQLKHRTFLNKKLRKMSLKMDTDDLAVQANSYASAKGIQVEKRTPDDKSVFEGAPMSLLPNAYPKEAFEQAVDVAPAFNELVDRVSRDATFLEETLGGGVSTMDPYTGKLLQLYKKVYVESEEGSAARQADRLGIHRSDYMLNADKNGDYRIKQVELNTIASSFAGLSCKIAGLHRYLTSRYETATSEFLTANVQKVSSSTESPSGVPSNPALEELPMGMKVAYDRYVERFAASNEKPVILFVVQEGETNTVDQRLLEFALWENHGIPVVRKSLTKLDAELVLEDGILKLGGKEVALVYFRAGYAPTDYPGGENGPEWNARLTLETSKAVKCPSLGYHLAGTKKVQQELARPGILERFFPDSPDKVQAMRACFAGLFGRLGGCQRRSRWRPREIRSQAPAGGRRIQFLRRRFGQETKRKRFL